jgi:Arc/MetJ-type ribon-helix-helix transcriptional regulator
MTINVSKDVENAINAAVRNGQFSSASEMIDKLVREYDQRKRQPAKRAKPKARTEEEILQQMLADGLITRLPDRTADIDDDDEPVVIEGEPLSETIIRERR